VPALTLVSGVLPPEVFAAMSTTFVNTRGLYAATRFESARGGKVTFTVAGGVREGWVNGTPVKVGAQFSAEVKPGVNTLVLQLDEARVGGGLRLNSADVSFVSN